MALATQEYITTRNTAAPAVSEREIRIQNQVISLDEKALQDIAETTGGKYCYAAESSALEEICANLGTQTAWIEERTEVTALVNALGTLLLMIGGLLGLRWFQQFP